MDETMTIVLLPFLGALVVSWIGTRIIIAIAPRFGWIAKTSSDRWHTRPTALMGGIAIYVAIVISILVFFIIMSDFNDRRVWGLLLGSTMIFILGLVDDRKYVSPTVKIVVQATAAGVVVAFGAFSEFFPPIIGIPLSIFWIIAITNAFNLIDNMDGLSSGIAAITSVCIMALSLIMGWYETAVLAAVMIGAALGFLRYNFNPARIFMGDCGALLIGFYLAVVTLIGTMTHMSNVIVVLVVPVLVMAVPILDTTFVTVMRTLSGRPFYQGGRDHTSHRMVIQGMSERATVLYIYLFSMVFGIFAVLFALPGVNIVLVATLLIVMVIFLFLLGLFLGGTEARDTKQRADWAGGELTISDRISQRRRRLFEIIADSLNVTASYILAYLIIGQWYIDPETAARIGQSLPIFIFFQMVSFYFFGIYRKLPEFITLTDVVLVVLAAALGTVVSSIVLFLFTFFQGYSTSVMIVYFLVVTFLVSARLTSLRGFKEYFTQQRARKALRRVLIFGAGDSGNAVLREILNNQSLGLRPLCFLDDDPAKIGSMIHGVKVRGSRESMKTVIQERKIDEVIIAVRDLPTDVGDYIERVCVDMGVPVRRAGNII
jgi:UDP-GlcNAc:undecaprenyl-phosphate GlcNAc-1-phosphate transferase